MCWVTFIDLLQLLIRLYCFVRSHWNQGNPLLFSFMLSALFFFVAVSFFLFFFLTKNTWKEVCNRSTLCFMTFYGKCDAYMSDGGSQSSGLSHHFKKTEMDVDRTKAETSRNRRRWTSLWPRVSGQWREWAVTWTLSIISGIGGHTRAWMEL